MTSQDDNRYFEEKQRGEQDRQKSLPPRTDVPPNTSHPYNKGYFGGN